MDIKGTDLPLLVSLDVLLEECNVTRAAQRLHLSQPALSAQLARLRERFGDPLLVPARQGRGMVRSPRAERLRQPLRQALAALGAVLEDAPAFDPQHSRRTFNIAASDNTAAHVAPALIARLYGQCGPDIQVTFRAVDARSVDAQLESGELDLLLCIQSELPENLKSRALFHDDYRMAQRKGHPRGKAAPDLDEYCRLRHLIVSPQGGGLRGFMDEHLAHLGRRRHVALSVGHYHLVPPILASTDLVCVMPLNLLQRHHAQLDVIDLPFAVPGYAVHVAWHLRSHEDPGHHWLRQCLFND
ncbi:MULTISPECIES: LysR family transcriptional regulator [Pseudomonas]|uniref:LysR family transcriptional regulator n=1 Tax=Pseudomonas TaxID=286 RepID=UPI0024A396ED|nr:LysR family transcriptional regulator [Pseudomonas sp. NBRC 100443]GLU37625.1 transcriptional regulator [Pseudomonas sp. NBRC 100443]